jgi:hypothetical protein
MSRKPYVSPSIRDYGDLVEVTAQVGGGFSDFPQGGTIGAGCPSENAPSCFSQGTGGPV